MNWHRWFDGNRFVFWFLDPLACEFDEYEMDEEKIVITQQDWMERQKLQHGKEEKYVCHCGKSYKWLDSLRRHARAECGNKEKAFSCHICDHKFRYRYELRKHFFMRHGKMFDKSGKPKANKFNLHVYKPAENNPWHWTVERDLEEFSIV